MMQLKLPFLMFIWTFCILLFLLDHSEAISKDDYIDLLELPNNDEFLWGRQSNMDVDDDLAGFQLFSSTGNASDVKRTKRQAILENKSFGPCTTSTLEVGQCRHVIYCRLPELQNDVWRLVQQLCIIEKTSIGICCPERVVNRVGVQFTNAAEEVRIVNQPPEKRGCGLTTKQFPRVTGGRPAEPDEWPWMAALLLSGFPYVKCGGVLVTDRHVLTAGHCMHKVRKEYWSVRLGEYNIKITNDTRARDFGIASVVVHTDYDPLTFEHDIALVRLDRTALFNTYIWPVCMPPLSESYEGKVGIVTGWGTQHFGGPYADALMEVQVPIWKNDDCRQVMVERIPDTVMCAGRPEGGQDSCQGDSGGPMLMQLSNRRWITIGVVSWGVRCGERNRPGVYTRVDKYLHWILQNADA